MRPDAIALAPVHATRVNTAIARIAASGIPLFGFINPIQAARCVSYVGADDYPIGVEIAQYLFAHLQGGGRVLVISGPVESVTSVARVRGFPATVSNHVKDLLRQHPAIELPAELVEGMARVAGYDYLKHGHPDAPHTRAVTDDMAERLTFVGTPEAIRERVQKLADAGVTHVCLYLSVVEPEFHVSTLETYGREIIPHFR